MRSYAIIAASVVAVGLCLASGAAAASCKAGELPCACAAAGGSWRDLKSPLESTCTVKFRHQGGRAAAAEPSGRRWVGKTRGGASRWMKLLPAQNWFFSLLKAKISTYTWRVRCTLPRCCRRTDAHKRRAPLASAAASPPPPRARRLVNTAARPRAPVQHLLPPRLRRPAEVPAVDPHARCGARRARQRRRRPAGERARRPGLAGGPTDAPRRRSAAPAMAPAAPLTAGTARPRKPPPRRVLVDDG
jgi:hypothetical protein